MDFTPHSRLRPCTKDVENNNSDGGTSEIEKDKWLDHHRTFSVLLMPRSLLIFKDEAYSGQYLWLPLPLCNLGLS
jgi:alkylated DNA repair protein alkB family protein 6